MGGTLSLIPELEDIVQRGSRAKRSEILRRITTLFLDGAGRYNAAHVDLFDDVFSLLIVEIESQARAALNSRKRSSRSRRWPRYRSKSSTARWTATASIRC